MRPIISLLANTNSSFLNSMQRLYSTLVGIPPNVTTVVQIRYDNSSVLAGQITRRVAPSVAPSTGCSIIIIILFFRMNIVH